MTPEKIIVGDAELWNGDSFEIFGAGQPVSDLILTDPPYDIFAGRGGGRFGNEASLINTGGFTDGGVSYDFLTGVPNWFCFCSRSQLHELIGIAQTCDRFNLITWCKPNPLPTCNNKYLPDVEYVVHGFAKGKLYGDMSVKSSFMVLAGKKETVHPNEKPIALITKLLASGTEHGSTVYDPFMGSGTTGVACVALGRKFIGVERERKYFDIACERITRAQKQGDLFGADENL